jgi:hypothetical protein
MQLQISDETFLSNVLCPKEIDVIKTEIISWSVLIKWPITLGLAAVLEFIFVQPGTAAQLKN